MPEFLVVRARLNWWIIFWIFTIHCLLNFTYKYLDFVARQKQISFRVPLIEEITGHYTALLLFPAVVAFIRRYPLPSKRWLRSSAIYLAVIAGFSATHTTLNAISRDLLFPLCGMGAYDYGVMRVRYAMEFPGDVFLFVLMAGIVYVVDLQQASKEREVAAAQMEGHLAQAQLQNLRLQLQPHFLFNALNTISAVMYENVRSADEMISRLSEFLRRTLNSPPSQEVRLADELQSLDLYLNVMRARFEDKLQVRLSIEPGLENALVPQLILQPLVENSIRHGAQPGSGRVDIDVTARRRRASLELEVRDRGRGLNGDLTRKEEVLRRGIGLANTASRLERLYGTGHHLNFENAAGGGLVVLLSIPLHA